MKLQTAVLVGPFEREAIRPLVFGRFEALLAASTRHPAMLMYLDQAQSVGPGSQVAGLGRMGVPGLKALNGLNENLAREIMELHTLGVGSGYTQADVTEFARALTGWSIVGAERRSGWAAVRRGGRARANSSSGPVSTSPARAASLARPMRRTARPRRGRCCATSRQARPPPTTSPTKLARHFVADDPPPALVERLERSFNASGGRLDRVAETLIDSPEAWGPGQRKFKTPYEFLISSYRAVDLSPQDFSKFGPVLTSLGQQPFNAPSPKGWAEEAEAWAAPDAIVKRMGWSETFAAAVAPAMGQPMQIAENSLGARLSPAVATAIAHAESRPEALSILLMSPEFQRR